MDLSFLTPELSIIEKIIRPLIVFLFLLIAFRISGKRELGSIGPFDLILWLTISNVLQNAMIGNDNSITGGLIGATSMLVANWCLTRISYKFPTFESLLKSKPVILVENGEILYKNLESELLTLDDLKQSLRKNQIDLDEDLPMLKKVSLESDGAITIIRRFHGNRGIIRSFKK